MAVIGSKRADRCQRHHAADRWLSNHGEDVGHRSTVDLSHLIPLKDDVVSRLLAAPRAIEKQRFPKPTAALA